jgi:hypothetical protein
MFSVPFLSTVNPIYNKASFDFKQKPVSGKKQSDGITSLTENPSVINADLLRQKIIKKRLSLLKPIKSEKDFKKVFENIITFLLYSFDNECENEDRIQLKTVKKFFGLEPINISDSEYLDFDGYEDIDFNLKGLVAYCGSADISRQINCWLTARKDSNPPQITDDQMADIIRAFEYSLRQLDNTLLLKLGLSSLNSLKCFLPKNRSLIICRLHFLFIRFRVLSTGQTIFLLSIFKN